MNTENFRSKALKCLEVFFYEEGRSSRSLGIADQAKFGKDRPGTSGPFGLFRGVQNQTGVVRKVTDDGIDLQRAIRMKSA